MRGHSMLAWASRPEPDLVLSVDCGSNQWCEGWVVRGQRRKASFYQSRDRRIFSGGVALFEQFPFERTLTCSSRDPARVATQVSLRGSRRVALLRAR